MSKIELTPIKGYALWIADGDDNYRDVFVGYYKDLATAEKDGKGKGKYADGKVIEMELHVDANGNLYNLLSAGVFQDDSDKTSQQ